MKLFALFSFPKHFQDIFTLNCVQIFYIAIRKLSFYRLECKKGRMSSVILYQLTKIISRNFFRFMD